MPVISTLNNLLDTGDELVHIEGILSGTLSFIFNSFGAGKTFSQVVADAKAKGFTEPDPREDLAGIPLPLNHYHYRYHYHSITITITSAESAQTTDVSIKFVKQLW